jgi:pyruvate/2-oxoglutarate dehydrogenase complex dihydrolipoamide acyltransferase (E2) component
MEFREVDATALLAARDRLATSLGATKQSVTPLLIRVVVAGLQQHPHLNARFDPSRGEVTEYESVHLGIATATPDGLIVPVLHDAQSATIAEIAGRVDRLTAAAKARTVTPEELAGGTVTVTNFGSFGTWLGTPIIRVPEVTIVGFGRIAERPVVVAGQVVARPTLPVVISVDHRVNDGAHLGAFAATLEQLITNPEQMGA